MRISDWSSDVCSSDLFTTEQGLGVGAVKRGPTFTRCIVVDDDPDILLSARLLLGDLLEEVAAFQSPDEALAAMHEGLPDVILLRSEEHTSDLQSLLSNSSAFLCLHKTKYHSLG